MQLQNKQLWYDNLRVIATIGVIGIHVSSAYIPHNVDISSYDFGVGNIYNSLSRCSVPIFVMLSGALLLPQEIKLSTFLRKRLVRLLIPFVFWSFAYIANSIANDYLAGNEMSFWKIAKTIYVNLRDGSASHLWYVYMIMGLYLFIPIIGKWARNCSNKEILYFLGIWAGTLILSQPQLIKFKPAIDFSYFSGYLGYLVLGYYLSNRVLNNSKHKTKIALLLILIGLFITIMGTYWAHLYSGNYVCWFYEPLSLNILIFASGVFICCKDKDIRFKPLIAIRNFISKYSYGIFLVHILILSKLADFGIQWNFINSAIGIPITTILCLSISSITIYLISKLPWGKYISG